MISIDRLKEMALEDIEKNPEKHLEEYTELSQQLDKLKQTLTEIKEFANKFDYWNSNLSQASEILHEIIEKISEVLDEEV